MRKEMLEKKEWNIKLEKLSFTEDVVLLKSKLVETTGHELKMKASKMVKEKSSELTKEMELTDEMGLESSKWYSTKSRRYIKYFGLYCKYRITIW